MIPTCSIRSFLQVNSSVCSSKYLQILARKLHTEFDERLQKTLSEVSKIKNVLNQVMNDPCVQDLGNKSYIEWQNKVRKNWDGDFWGRKSVLPAAIKAVSPFFEQNIPSGDSKILELGSNGLDWENRSYLAQLMPPKFLDRMIYSDAFEHIVKKESQKTKTPYFLLDANTLASNLQFSPSVVAAINVFDVFKRKDFPNIAHNIYQSLESKGKALILADQPICTGSLVDLHSDPNYFVIVGSNGIMEASLVDMRRAIHRIENVEFKELLNKILDLTPTQRHIFLNFCSSQGVDISPFFNSLMKEENVSTEFYSHIESYVECLNKAFVGAGFEITHSDFVHGVIEQSEELDENCLSTEQYIDSMMNPKYVAPNAICNNMKTHTYKVYIDSSLQTGILKTETYFHVFIAEKKD